MKKWVIGSLFGCAVLLFAMAAVYYFFWPKSNGEVSIEFSKLDPVSIGEPFTLEVSASNNGSELLKNAKISLSVPEGVAFVGKSGSARFVEQVIGDMGAGVLTKQSFTLIATGGAQSVKRLEARVTYLVGVNARVQFEAKESFDLEVGPPAMNVSFEVPEKVFSGQDFDLTIHYENTSGKDFDMLKFKIDYPPVFQFTKSKPQPSRSNTMWDIGPLKRGEKGTIVISGNVLGSDNLYFQFRGTLSTELSGELYPVAVQDANLTVAGSPLSLSVSVQGEGSERIINPGDPLSYLLTFKNNSNVALENITINATFTGEMFDFARSQTTGSFNSVTNTFSWNAGNAAQLRQLGPGESGSVNVFMAVRSDFPIKRVSDKHYTLKVKGRAESPTVPDAQVGKTIAIAALENKIAGKIALISKAFFRDPSNVVNAGQFPPHANRPTQYTVHWIIKNYSTDVASIRISASLQSNTRFVKVVKSTLGAEPKYNPASGEVTWEIANVPATKGLIGQPVEAVFQIENTPAITQVGQYVVLMSPVKLTAEDTFTGVSLTSGDDQTTTQLPWDTTLGQNRLVEP